MNSKSNDWILNHLSAAGYQADVDPKDLARIRYIEEAKHYLDDADPYRSATRRACYRIAQWSTFDCLRDSLQSWAKGASESSMAATSLNHLATIAATVNEELDALDAIAFQVQLDNEKGGNHG